MFKQLVTAIYYAPDIEKAKAWYGEVLGFEPYFDEAFYVGFSVGGYELGLQPGSRERLHGLGGSVPYWRVDDIEASFKRLLELGATVVHPVEEVGDSIKTALVEDPFGNALGIIQNPHFGVTP